MGRLNSYADTCNCCGGHVPKYGGFIYQNEAKQWLCHHKTCNPNAQPYDVPELPKPAEPTTEPTEEQDMTTKTTKLIERRTFINGVDASTLSDDAIFDILAVAGAEVACLEAVTIRPAKLNRKIDKLTVAIEKVGRYVDNR